ncbi:MAG: DUF2721 domain-containing protein [Acidobacteria bacterium]|jgi:hypothetical protein|nr:DUF2721 domain-containing protein [Acidobacteriota bacterium]
MENITRLFQAFVAPAIFVSAISLLILSINVRLMGIVARLRQYARARYDATRAARLEEAGVYTEQIILIERRAEWIRRCFLFALVSLVGAIVSCLLLGLGLYWKHAALLAVAVFVLSMLCLLGAVGYYLREVVSALSAVRDETRDPRFSAPPEGERHDSV